MKKLLFVLISLFLAWVIYVDLSKGTIPLTPLLTTNSPPQTSEMRDDQGMDIDASNTDNTYKAVHVQSGDTVLTIVERLHDEQLPISIQQVIEDFENLNPGVQANNIQTNKTYYFPLYQ
ncbi:hypothetical protein EJF36_13785 [Bacillus sp. HMF5848]|uniref:hypothetical protein n=1 Tax=Bacillus sp. HMF5848 TaxID=2495421 RepID=UPI000F76A04B|nr:hypothetical protein [Bacillus sp. HMF5848]RSK27862.1 hypothetical protein EJF36_13785 [Bacillus sp. HMF5848]